MCLVGSARAFEATGPSLLRHLLLPSAHPSSHPSHRSSHLSHPPHHPLHLFLHAPLDETTAKLGLFGGIKGGGFGAGGLGVEGVTIASVKIFPSSDLDETDNRKRALNWESSPQGLQGLLQYFRLVEGCWDMIQSGVGDGLAYTIPYGSDWWGFNDRFGMGGRQASAVALRRLSALDKMVAVGFSQLNSEMAFKAQMDMGGVRVERQNLSFCILTRRMYPLEDDSCPVKILSATAKVPLNGAKCRLCTPCKAGEEAEQALAAIPDTAPNWPGPFTQGIDMCSIHQPWEDMWQQQYDAVMGAELARQRQAVVRMAADVALCVRSFEQLRALSTVWSTPSPVPLCLRALPLASLRALSSVWSAPSPLVLCVRGQLGETKLLGTNPRQFATFTRLLSSTRCAGSGVFSVLWSPSPLARFPSPLAREGEGRREGEGSQKAAETPSPFENSEWDEQKPAETSGTWEAELRSLFPTISILHRPPSWLQQSQQADSTERERGGQEDQGGEGVQRGEVAREEEYKREAEDGLLWRVDVVKVDVADLDPALIAAWATAMHDALSEAATAARRHVDEQLERAGFHLASYVGSVPNWDCQCCSYTSIAQLC
ncbi:unnamed protein product [Closterium sp. NIES-65]|nr:unnamed protein product [Closterium sp. NIES-65]